MITLEQRIVAALGAMDKSEALQHYNGSLLSQRDLLAMPEPEFLTADYLPAQGYSVVYGPPGVGKTLLFLAIAKHVCRGTSWFDHKTKHGPVLFIEGEDMLDFGPRIRAFDQQHDRVNSELPAYYLPETVDLTKPAELARIVRTGNSIRDKNGSLPLVVIDPLMEQMTGDENAEGMEAVSRGLRVLAMELGTCVLAGHHTNAAETRERGNAKLKARAHAQFRMEPIEEARVGLLCEKQRSGPKVAAEMEMVPVGPSVVLSAVWEGSALAYGQRRQDARARSKRLDKEQRQQFATEMDDVLGRQIILEALDGGNELNQTALLAACRGKGVGSEALKAVLRTMVGDDVVRRKVGQAHVYRLSDS